MRDCGECNLCCTGIISVKTEKFFSHKKPCEFLNSSCTIHSSKPEICKKFECLWLQEIFPEDWKPNKIGFLAYEINAIKYKFFKFLFSKNFIDEIYLEIDKFCKEKNVPYILKAENEWFVIGPEDFKKHININSKIFLID